MNTSRPRRMGLSHFWRQQAEFLSLENEVGKEGGGGEEKPQR